MDNLHTVSPSNLPKEKMSLLLDWLVTLKCNYDCSYCGLTGHDNTTKHPPVERCVTMLKQMYRYADVINETKKKTFKDTILNIYGGEAINHPRIIEILESSSREYQKYNDRWNLRRRLTTNATVAMDKWTDIIKHVEGVTVSYHAEGPEKLKNNVKSNILCTKDKGLEYDVHVLLYPHPTLWADVVNFIDWCDRNDINIKPKLLDGNLGVYQKHHIEYIERFMDTSNMESGKVLKSQGRACCGGRTLCINNNKKNRQRFIKQENSNYTGWHCSVRHFFLHANSVKGTFYSNKDCKVTDNQTLGPLATIDTMDNYIANIEEKIKKQQDLFVNCVQKHCVCGICAPKSTNLEILKKEMEIYF